MSIGNLVERTIMGNTSVLEYDLRKQQIANYAAFAKLALLIYDIFINMDREVRLVWSTSDRFRWSNVIYYTNRYPVLAYQIWSVCYTPRTPQLRCPLSVFLVLFIHPDTRSHHGYVWLALQRPLTLSPRILRKPSTASWILRVYAVVDHGLIFATVLSLLGLAIVGFDILQGVQSTCTHNTLSSETLQLGF
ncbi:hypothetical protein J3R30DRAFT_485584 [Lentinula aciculospora]|uniref:DUF6533 domain-containing protein n=1 Tax=Lentinula aciculospora TaxID=153920 RepID=A0A9W9DDB6_9AGAR|nr:hypothetical protein J3R30DRAFT_485584 [Lentinula aciculospora]